jgi:Ni,Fe-hydrogenase III large subunit
LCEAVEEAQGIEVPDSDAAMRVVLSEWARIASHLEVISDLGLALEDDLVYGRPRRYVDRIRFAFEGMCRNPFGFGVLVPGGVEISGDLEAMDELSETAKALARDCGFWAGKLRMSRPRLAAGRIAGSDLPEGHPPAPAFRASGSSADLRSGEDARGFYSELGYRPVRREGGTALDRAQVLLGEIVSSLELIEKVRRVGGECRGAPDVVAGGKGSSSGAWESPHGALEYRVLMGSEGRIMRVRVFGAARDVADLSGRALQGTAAEDVSATIVSLNLCERCMGD